ncbi:MAG: T9SS type A sorting domain-containing protein [Saprospiraceae bacterium]
MKKLYIFFLFSVLGLVVNAQNLSDLSFGTDSTLEIITWNIEWFPKNGMTTVDSVRQIVETLDADIIACQEIGDTNVWKQMVALMPDYETVFQANRHRGLAYLYKSSSVEIIDYYEIYTASSYRNNFPRSPKVLEFRVQGEEFIIINNHLKCCGDGTLSYGVTNDEENRRYEAMNLLKTYIDTNFPTENVFVVGDLNDELTDDESHNVFQTVLGDIFNYKFVDMDLAEDSPFVWSYPSWPSHLDHIMITNELFDEFASSSAVIETIRIEDFLQGGFSYYDSNISDHRPVAFKFDVNSNTTSTKTQLSSNTLGMYPNPATTNVTIELEKSIKNGTVEIYNWNGQLLKSTTIQQVVNLDISDLITGVYTVRIQSTKDNWVKQLIIR